MRSNSDFLVVKGKFRRRVALKHVHGYAWTEETVLKTPCVDDIFFFEMERNVRFQIKTDTLRRVRRRVGECCSYVFSWSVGNQIIIKVAIAHSMPTIVLVCHMIVTLSLRFSKWT